MASDLAASDLVSKCTTTDTGLEVTLAKNVSVVTRVGGDGNMLLTLSSGAAAATAPAATGNGSVLHVNVASVNIKKIDLKVCLFVCVRCCGSSCEIQGDIHRSCFPHRSTSPKPCRTRSNLTAGITGGLQYLVHLRIFGLSSIWTQRK